MPNVSLPSQAGISNAASVDQAIAAATLAYINGSVLAIPSSGLVIGATFRWHVVMTKTAAGTAARSFHVRVGILGTTGDTSVATMTTGVGTAAIDTGVLDIIAIVQGPITSLCKLNCSSSLYHELATTGFLTKAQDVKQVLSAAFDATVQNFMIGLSVQAGASEVLTIKQVVSEGWGM